jgi:hypothetical protein
VVDLNALGNAKKGSSASLLFLPAYEAQSIVANLDHVVTVEKSILVLDGSGPRARAIRNDQELNVLGASIARKLNRFAFPDDFNEAMRKFQDRVISKAKKDSPEGHAYNSVSEIRVVTENAWGSPKPEPAFLFFFEDENSITESVRKLVSGLVDQFIVGGRYSEKPKFRCVIYKDVDAQTYLRSFRLDLEYLSKTR